MNLLKKLYFNSINKKIVLIAKVCGITTSLICFLVLHMSPDSRSSIFAILFFAVLIIIFMNKILYRVVNKPLLQLQEFAKKMCNLDYSSACEINTQDEFEELADIFNEMATNLKQALNEVTECNQRIEKEMDNVKHLHEQRKELVDMLSHELKTPIGVIRAYGEAVKNDLNDEVRKKYSTMIVEAADEMSELILSLLDLSALESGANEIYITTFEFNDFLTTMIGRLLADIPEKEFELLCNLPNTSCYIEADKKRMEQVINNLLVNAKKYVNVNGKINIKLEEMEGKWQLLIENTGEVLNNAAAQMLCTKFYRAEKKNTVEGNGLGLTIVSKILDIHNFYYEIRSKEGIFSVKILIPKSKVILDN